MAVNPQTPVLVGYGQINHHHTDPVEPVELMVAAARRAGAPALLEAVDTVRVVNLLSAQYRDPGLLLAQRLGLDEVGTGYTGVGGNTPQTLLNRTCHDIQHGRAGVVLLAGGETWRTRTRLRAAGGKLSWTHQDDTVAPAARTDQDVPMAGPAEERIRLDRPAYVYPLFEQALRGAAGVGVEEHRGHLGALWARFAAVAAENPHAWIREPVAAEQIWRPGRDNRMISWPYTKLMNSNNMVDQAAALILTSVQTALRLQIPTERWVFPYTGTEAHDTYAISERAELHRSPAIRIGAARALRRAGLGVDDVDYLDLYSCFPSAVQVAAAEIGLAVDDPGRPLTVTGGLTFAGGPWNNYVMHAIATMAERLVAHPGSCGLVTANGGYLTKHSFGVYGTEPPSSPFTWEDVQPAVDAEPGCTAAVQWEGTGTVEAWTVPYDRDGNPAKAFVSVRTPDRRRTLAWIDDPAAAADTVDTDMTGAAVTVHADGTAALD